MSSRVRRVLVVRRRGAISHPLIHKAPDVEDRTSSLKERSGQNRDSVAKTTQKKKASRAASRGESGSTDICNTEVGGREGAAEKAVEWRQRMDQEGEEKLGNP